MFTTTKHLTLCALSLALTASAASAQQFTVEAPSGPIVTVDGAPTANHVTLGATRSFRMQRGFRGADAAREISGRLMARGRGLAAPLELPLAATTDGKRLQYVDPADPSAFVSIDTTTGDISFCRGMRGVETAAPAANLPRGQAAVERAVEHLERLGLMPARRDELVVRHVGGLRMSERLEDGTTQEFDKLTTVHFGRVIDGLPVGGPGSKITVHLGEEGALVGLQRRWIELEASANAEAGFLTDGEAVGAVEGHLRSEWTRAQSVRSERPTAGLFDDGRGVIEPAYFFRAELAYDPDVHEFARGEYTKDYLGVVPALRQSRASFRQQERAPAASDAGAEPAPQVDPADDDEPTRR